MSQLLQFHGASEIWRAVSRYSLSGADPEGVFIILYLKASKLEDRRGLPFHQRT